MLLLTHPLNAGELMNAKGQGSPFNSYARPCCISNPSSKYQNRTRPQQPKYQQPFLLPLFDGSLRSLALSSTDLTELILSLTNQASQLFRALRNRKCQGRQTLHKAIPVFFISDPSPSLPASSNLSRLSARFCNMLCTLLSLLSASCAVFSIIWEVVDVMAARWSRMSGARRSCGCWRRGIELKG